MSSYRIACNQLVLGCRYPFKVFFIIIWLSFLSVQFVFYFFLRSCAPPTAEFVIQKGEWGLLPPKKKREEEIDSLWRARDLRKERKYNSVRNIYDDVGCPPPFFFFCKILSLFSQQPICTFLLAEQIGLYFDGLFFHLPFGSYRGSAMTCMAKNRKKKEIETSPSTGLFPFRTCSVSLPFVLVNSLSCVTSNWHFEWLKTPVGEMPDFQE